MKTTFLYIVFYVMGSLLCAQGAQKYDYNWILGYPSGGISLNFGGVHMDFNDNTVEPERFDIIFPATEPTVLSMSSGHLLIYSNGCTVIGSDHQTIANGDSINYGYIWDQYCEYGYLGTQNQLLLPWPEDTSKAILFHIMRSEDYRIYSVLYTVIGFTPENPHGIVLEKNKALLHMVSGPPLTATRHANGRDWWILLAESSTQHFYSLLLSPSGLTVTDTQATDLPMIQWDWDSQAAFSPDGKWYARFNYFTGLHLFEFDRCTGTLSPPLVSGPLTDPLHTGGGVAFSHDTRFLYVSNIISLFQYDLHAPDILASRTLVGEYDGYLNPFHTTFYQMALAPDGRIYMFSNNGVRSLHVIHHPDRQGTACGFVQHAIEFPVYLDIGAINMPHYRLGPVYDSPCDTLSIRNGPVADFRYETDSLDAYTIRFRNLSYFDPDTHSWDFGDHQSSTLQHPGSHRYETPGKYKICLVVANAHGQDSMCRMIVIRNTTTSVAGQEHAIPLRVFPSPFDDVLYIALTGPAHILQLDWYTMTGTPIWSAYDLHDQASITTTSWAPGMYFYQARLSDGRTITGKAIKSR